jgi:hypothetical protein
VARNTATASGRITPEAATGMPSFSVPRSIAGREASEDWVLIATACAGPTAFV